MSSFPLRCRRDLEVPTLELNAENIHWHRGLHLDGIVGYLAAGDLSIMNVSGCAHGVLHVPGFGVNSHNGRRLCRGAAGRS